MDAKGVALLVGAILFRHQNDRLSGTYVTTSTHWRGWNGVLAPAAVPKDIIARLNAVIVKAVNTPEMKETLVKQGFEAQGNTPEEFAAFIRNELAQNARLAKFAGVKVE